MRALKSLLNQLDETLNKLSNINEDVRMSINMVDEDDDDMTLKKDDQSTSLLQTTQNDSIKLITQILLNIKKTTEISTEYTCLETDSIN